MIINHGVGSPDQVQGTDEDIFSHHTDPEEEGTNPDNNNTKNADDDDKPNEKPVVKWEKIDATKKQKEYTEGIRNQVTMLNGFVCTN